ncbi:YggS family pyridoxal phosphate-dependent enzyme [Actinobaculum suis]|uniref:YggS family pyridoxal phosphate-dependent enzyme n=1 Tax=Actinobaculum suis TaxID=1657 RepID=UPI0009F4BF0E|nr:YggS family pyridoxal phosphate-dependent enzyme [Actinobaculum suis]
MRKENKESTEPTTAGLPAATADTAGAASAPAPPAPGRPAPGRPAPARSGHTSTAPTPTAATPTAPTELAQIPSRIDQVVHRLREAEVQAGRSMGETRLQLAVKYQPIEKIRAALEHGCRFLGQNLIQQLEAVETQITDVQPHWTHVIGHVQSNKAGKALEFANCIESLDSERLARRLDRLQGTRIANGEATEPFEVYIQVNSAGSESQYGVAPEKVAELAGIVSELPNLRLGGLMTIGAHTDDVREVAASFARTRELRDELQSEIPTCTELSMGMTHDMEIAVKEGSTIVRVGTAVFGPRPRP